MKDPDYWMCKDCKYWMCMSRFYEGQDRTDAFDKIGVCTNASLKMLRKPEVMQTAHDFGCNQFEEGKFV